VSSLPEQPMPPTAPVRQRRRPLVSDYLTDAEMDRLAATLYSLLVGRVDKLRKQGLNDEEITSLCAAEAAEAES